MSNGQVRRIKVNTGEPVVGESTRFDVKNITEKTIEGAVQKNDLLAYSKQELDGVTPQDFSKVKKALSKILNLQDTDNTDYDRIHTAVAPELNLVLVLLVDGVVGLEILTYEQVGNDLVFLQSQEIAEDSINLEQVSLEYSGQDGVFFYTINEVFGATAFPNRLRRINYNSGTKTFTHEEITSITDRTYLSALHLSRVPNTNIVCIVILWDDAGTITCEARFFTASATADEVVYEAGWIDVTTDSTLSVQTARVALSDLSGIGCTIHFTFTTGFGTPLELGRRRINSTFDDPYSSFSSMSSVDIFPSPAPSIVDSIRISDTEVLFKFDRMGGLSGDANGFMVISSETNTVSDLIKTPQHIVEPYNLSGWMAVDEKGKMMMFYAGGNEGDELKPRVYFAKIKENSLEFTDFYCDIGDIEIGEVGRPWFNPSTMNFGFMQKNPSADLDTDTIGFNHALISSPSTIVGMANKAAEDEQSEIDLGPSVATLAEDVSTSGDTIVPCDVYRNLSGEITTDKSDAIYKIGKFLDNRKILFER